MAPRRIGPELPSTFMQSSSDLSFIVEIARGDIFQFLHLLFSRKLRDRDVVISLDKDAVIVINTPAPDLPRLESPARFRFLATTQFGYNKSTSFSTFDAEYCCPDTVE